MRMLARERGDRPEDLREVQGVLARFTQVKPRPFEAPGALPSGEGVDRVSGRPPSRTPVVDTQSPQSIPNGVHHRPRRSVIAGAVAGATVLAAFVGWRVSAPGHAPSVAQGLVQSATGVDAPRALIPLTTSPMLDAAVPGSPATSALTGASPDLANQAASARSVRMDAPARGTSKAGAVSGSPSKVDRAAVAPPLVPAEMDSAKPKPAPGGLAEKPPF